MTFRKPSAGFVLGTIAVSVAMAGSAVAGSLITSRQIKDGTIQSKDISKKARAALRGARGPVGATGPAGAKGDAGTPGTPGTPGQNGAPGAAAIRHFVSARSSGELLSGSPGASVSKYGGQTGAYKVEFPQDVTNCVAVANIGETVGNALPPGEATSRTNGHPIPSAANSVDVITRNSAGTSADLPFNLVVAC